MSDTLIQRLRRHRGDYVEEMDEAADALEQQAAQVEALRAALQLAMWAMRAPLDDWKGECERKALDAAHAALGPNVRAKLEPT